MTTPLTHNTNNAATGGIWRVPGKGILKLARPPGVTDPGSVWPTSDDPRHWNYWKREVLAYESGLAAAAFRDAGIRSPDVIDIVPRDTGEIELWLADVPGTPGTAWTPQRLGNFAGRLGRAQSAYLQRVPDLAFLSHNWLAQYLAEGPARRVWIDSDEHWAAATEWRPPVVAGVRRLWEQRHEVLAIATAAPRTLCHLDVWPMNLIDDGGDVLLDWAFVGAGGVGEDAANLIVDSVTDGLMDIALLPEIVECVLRECGAAPEYVRAYAVAKYCWLAPVLVGAQVRGHRAGSANYGGTTPAVEVMRRLEPLMTLLAGWADATLDEGHRRRP